MCGRYVISSSPEALRRLFGYGEQPNFPPRFNVAPTQPVPVVIRDNGARHFRLMRWGFMPAWVKDPRGFALVINARAETVLDKPSFRNAIRRRRCLVPADGYYEWQAASARKRPFFIHRRDGAPFAFAGLTETWAGPNGEEVDTVAIITAAARADMAVLHDRVPVTIDPADFERWLDGDALSAAAAMGLLIAPQDGAFVWHEVSTSVNRVANDRADLIAPLPAPAPAAERVAAQGSLF
jgi:putative SOS response-associated peptidase YedK